MVLRGWYLGVLVLIQILKSWCIMHSAEQEKKRMSGKPDRTFYRIYFVFRLWNNMINIKIFEYYESIKFLPYLYS